MHARVSSRPDGPLLVVSRPPLLPKGTAMSRFLFRIGHFAGSHPWRVLAAWAVIATSVVLLNSAFGGALTEEFSIPGAESQRAADALEARFPQETLYTSTI